MADYHGKMKEPRSVGLPEIGTPAQHGDVLMGWDGGQPRLIPLADEAFEFDAEIGTSAAMTADRLVVGARSWRGYGGALLYRRQEHRWELMHELHGPEEPVNHFAYLGASVAVHGDFAAAGAPRTGRSVDVEDRHTGTVFLFEATEEEVTRTEFAPPIGMLAGDKFGFSVALGARGDVLTLVAGAPAPDPKLDRTGGAFVLELEGDAPKWARLEPPKRGFSTNAFVGYSVAVHGDVLVVGAPRAKHRDDTADDTGRGAVYVYERKLRRWKLQRTLWGADKDSGERFGDSVALAGDLLVVGVSSGKARGVDDDGNAKDLYSGVVDVFERDGDKIRARTRQRITPAVPETGADFGGSVAVSEHHVIVGASTTGGNAGAATVFYRRGKVLERSPQTLAPMPPYPKPSELGTSVAAADGHLVITAPKERRNPKASKTDGNVYCVSGPRRLLLQKWDEESAEGSPWTYKARAPVDGFVSAWVTASGHTGAAVTGYAARSEAALLRDMQAAEPDGRSRPRAIAHALVSGSPADPPYAPHGSMTMRVLAGEWFAISAGIDNWEYAGPKWEGAVVRVEWFV